MCVLLITRLLRGVGRWASKPVNHTSWVTVVTPTDRPKSVRNCCLIELFCGVVCVVTLPLWHFCWYRGFCHRTGSDLLLFVCTAFMRGPGKACALLETCDPTYAPTDDSARGWKLYYIEGIVVTWFYSNSCLLWWKYFSRAGPLRSKTNKIKQTCLSV